MGNLRSNDGFIIPSRPTDYKGQRFNSRLEAQWAVFFDCHGIERVYEPYPLRLPSGVTYLPDFFLPQLSTWFEVKGPLDAQTCAKPLKLYGSVEKYGQRIVIGSSKGIVRVPFRDSDGRQSTDGAILSCQDCDDVWFDNLFDPTAATCPHCGSVDGGKQYLAAAKAAFKAGISSGWIGNFSQYKYRHLLSDASPRRCRLDRIGSKWRRNGRR